MVIALLSTIGTLLSCTLVAYGFARFSFPGRSLLFTLLIATIFLPAAVTIIPTYTIFQRIGWVGHLAAPAGAGVLRERVRRVPDAPVLHDDPDGPGRGRRHRWRRTVPDPISVVLPQAWPVIVAVAVFHLVYSWNDFFGPLIYTAGKVDLQTVALGLQRFNGIYYREPGLSRRAR